MSLGKIFNEALSDAADAGKQSVKDIAKSPSGGEFAGNILLKQPALMGLRLGWISFETTLKLAALFGGKMAKGAGLALSAASVVPILARAKRDPEHRLQERVPLNIGQVQDDTRLQLAAL